VAFLSFIMRRTSTSIERDAERRRWVDAGQVQYRALVNDTSELRSGSGERHNALANCGWFHRSGWYSWRAPSGGLSPRHAINSADFVESQLPPGKFDEDNPWRSVTRHDGPHPCAYVKW